MSEAHSPDSEVTFPEMDSDLEASSAPGESEDFAALLEQSVAQPQQTLEQGAVVKGLIVKLGQDSVFVDLGGKSEGVIDPRELRDESGALTVSVGDEIEATVVGYRDEDWGIRLSRSLVQDVRDRDMLQEAFENRLVVEGKVVGRNKGGYEVSVSGVRGFVPMSHIDRARAADPDVHLQQIYKFRILELKGGGKNVVLSRTVLQKEEAEEKARVLRETLKEGDVVCGTVRTIRDYGAFVDIGGMDGLLHVSEISWGRTERPSDVLTEGQQVTVQVIKFDREKDKLSFSLKQLASNPWDEVGTRFAEGGVYVGTVTRLQQFGAFVELAPGLEGLLHVSNMTWERRIQHPKEIVKEGEQVTVQILNIDLEKRRLGLGMKQLGGDPWDGIDARYQEGARISGKVEKVANFGIFVNLEPGVTGLIPNSEMATDRGANHSRMFAPGQEIEALVLDVDPEERRFTLSRKGLLAEAERESLETYKADGKAGNQKRPPREASGGSLGTLGSLASIGEILQKAKTRAR